MAKSSMAKHLGADDIFRRWEEQKVSVVEKEQLDKWGKDSESCPQVKRGKNFYEERWTIIPNIIESQGENMKNNSLIFLGARKIELGIHWLFLTK